MLHPLRAAPALAAVVLLSAGIAVGQLAPRPAPSAATPSDSVRDAAESRARDEARPIEIPSLRVLDLSGAVHLIGPAADFHGAALVFLDTSCPIARQSIPGLNELAREASESHVELFGVLSDPDTRRAAALDFVREFGIEFPILLDSTGALALTFEPSHAPEAFVLDRAGKLAYRGRIDDRAVVLGVYRPEARERDLQEALRAVARGAAPRVARTEPVGCRFELAQVAALPETPNYAQHIAPVLQASCVECHRKGGAAPFPLENYEQARRKAGTIADVVESRSMPPWKPVEHFGRLAGERRLHAREIALLSAWAAKAAPEGVAQEAPPAPVFPTGWRLGEPDLVLEMPEPLHVPASGPDLYRAFVVPMGLDHDVHVRAVEFQPGSPEVVHHAIFFLDAKGQARSLDEADPQPGFQTFGGPGFAASGGLGNWGPGFVPRPYPEDSGVYARRGSDVVMQIHYHPMGRAQSDRSRIALWITDEPVAHPMLMVWPLNQDIDIPAGTPHYERSIEFTLPVAVEIYGIAPHMHFLGREMRVRALKPDGAEVPLVWIDDWDFRWQDMYRLAQPASLPKGTRFEVYARYDNSEANPRNPSHPPRRVRRGEGTLDEMCMLALELTTHSNAETFLLFEEAKRHGFVTAGAVSR